MPDEVTNDTGSPQDGSADGNQSGGAAQSAPKAGSDATDQKARIKELEQMLAKETGKAGSLKATLTEQLTAAITEAQSEKAKVADLTKQIQQRDVIDDVLSRTPEKSRGAVRLAAAGIILKVDLSDPTKAAEAVIAKITAEAPDLFAKSTAVQHMPHNPGDRTARTGFAFSPSGKRLV